jgi:IS5 family transposase
VLHRFRVEKEYSQRETSNRLEYIVELRELLDLDQDELPDYTTIYNSFDRLKMRVRRALLRVSAQQHPQSGHAALDSTFFDRRISSSYHRQRSGNSVQTLKLTTLTDVESLALLEAHIFLHAGNVIPRPGHGSSAGTRATCRPSPQTTVSKTGTPSTRSPR